jgi:hypothetical protein
LSLVVVVGLLVIAGVPKGVLNAVSLEAVLRGGYPVVAMAIV